jgi:hypothetical protein
MEPEFKFQTKRLIEKLQNALESGYEILGETEIGELLAECQEERPTPNAADAATEPSCQHDFGMLGICVKCGVEEKPRR